MARFDLDSIKDALAELLGKAHAENVSDKDDEYSDDEEQYEDEDYSSDEYEDDGEYADEGEYDEADYEDAEGDEYADDEYADDGEYDEDTYEDGEDVDGEYEDGEYDEYDDGEEEDAYNDDLGYNPAVFDDLDGEAEEGEYEDGEYADGEYDDGDYTDEADEGDEAGSAAPAWTDKVKEYLDNDYVLYALIALIPPLAIYLIWRGRKYESNKKWILTALAVIFLVLWIILLWPSSNRDDPTDPGDFINPNFTATATATMSVTDAPTASPSPTLHAGGATATPAAGSQDNNPTTYVWTTNANPYYHTVENCDGLQNANRMTLETAVSQNKTACPICAGGTNNYADNTTPTQFYATTRGTWYHVDPVCQGMTGASIVTESNAIAAGKTACPVCIGYYGTPGGKWYHVVSNCQGMTNAITQTKADWEKAGKTECPVCMNKTANGVQNTSAPTETQVYCTGGGENFHVLSDCRGMKNASQMGISKAVSMGKTACKYCMLPAKVSVFATQNGTYYHTLATCQGMKGAQYVTAKQAISAGKRPCTKCNAGRLFASSTSVTNGNTAAATQLSNGTAASTLTGKTTTDTATYVYATKNGTYYHTKSNCSGMKNAARVTYADAIKAGKKPCPTCISISSVNVFATSKGKYFHTKANCSGMTGALSVSISKALSAGKTACPTCAKALGNLAGSKNAAAAATATSAAAANASATPAPAAASNSIVYIKSGEKYYHRAAKCSGQSFSGGINVTLEYALEKGYKSCPSCNPPSKIST